MKTSWESHPYYIDLHPERDEVVFGSNSGGTGHTDNAQSMSYDEFRRRLEESPQDFNMFSVEEQNEIQHALRGDILWEPNQD